MNPTRALVRRFLDEILRSDADLDQFLLDYFPKIQRTVGAAQNRLSKINLLVEAATNAEIWEVLARSYDAENPKYAHLLRGEGQEPEWVSRRLKCRGELETLQAARVILFRHHDDCSSIDNRIIEVKRILRADEMLVKDDVLGDRYYLLKKISHGGFAVVWLARDLEARLPETDPAGLVALKILHRQHFNSEEQRDRFARGARAMKQLEDVPGVVRVRNGPLTDVQIYFYAMEYHAGGTLHGEVLGGRIDRQQALSAVLTIGRVLQEAHRQRILHRDVKPANILLDGEGRAHLTDFDLTVIGLNTHASVAGQPKGTYGFAPPELLQGNQGDVRADVYSLAMTVLFVLLRSDDLFATGLPPSDLIQRLDESLEVQKVLYRATYSNPERRYPSVKSFCDDLRAALGQINPQQPIILPLALAQAPLSVQPLSAQQRPPKLLLAPSPPPSQTDSARITPGGMPQVRLSAESDGLLPQPPPTSAVQPSVTDDAATTAAPVLIGDTVSSASSAIPAVEPLVTKPLLDSELNTGKIGPRRLTNKREQVILIGVGLVVLVTGLGIGAVLTRSPSAGGVATLPVGHAVPTNVMGKTNNHDREAEPPANLQAGQKPAPNPIGAAGITVEPLAPKPTSPISPLPGHRRAASRGQALPPPTLASPKKKPIVEKKPEQAHIGNLPIPPSIDHSVANDKLLAGRSAIKASQNDVGFDLCHEAEGNDRIRGLALACMGEAEFGRGRYREAIKLGKLALKYEGFGSDLYLLLGKAHSKLKDCSQAHYYYDRVLLSADGNHPEAQRGIALCKE